MTTYPVASRSEGLGDDALTAATGRTWEQWFELLDAAGATEWTHPRIAASSRDAAYPTARWNLGERESLLARANPTRNGKTSVSLTHSGIADADRVAGSKSAMLGWLAGVVS